MNKVLITKDGNRNEFCAMFITPFGTYTQLVCIEQGATIQQARDYVEKHNPECVVVTELEYNKVLLVGGWGRALAAFHRYEAGNGGNTIGWELAPTSYFGCRTALGDALINVGERMSKVISLTQVN